MSKESSEIDEIKKGYDYLIDPKDLSLTAFAQYAFCFGNFLSKLKSYSFEKQIEEIRIRINEKGDKIEKNLLETYKKKIQEISEGIKNIDKKVTEDSQPIMEMLIQISNDYKKNICIPGAADIYVNISKEIIDKQIDKFIKYEKILLKYNDYIFYLRTKI